MKKPLSSYTAPLVALSFGALIFAGHAQTVTQNITLQPGWNSVFLEVQPSNTRQTRCSGLPVASVWMRAERRPVWTIFRTRPRPRSISRWLGWFHPSRPGRF
jgi:hypothetical protein